MIGRKTETTPQFCIRKTAPLTQGSHCVCYKSLQFFNIDLSVICLCFNEAGHFLLLEVNFLITFLPGFKSRNAFKNIKLFAVNRS